MTTEVWMPGKVTVATFTLANNLLEQTIIEVSNPGRAIQDVNIRLNVVALTRNNAIFRFYAAIDGTTFIVHNTITLAAADTEAHHDEPALAAPFRITLQSVSLEGASRAIPYELTQVPR